jgi:hypothetical protein
MRIVYGQHLIPNRDALENIVRYETTIERSLDRALNRLERLQRQTACRDLTAFMVSP